MLPALKGMKKKQQFKEPGVSQVSRSGAMYNETEMLCRGQTYTSCGFRLHMLANI